jgi:hypothetical protein
MALAKRVQKTTPSANNGIRTFHPQRLRPLPETLAATVLRLPNGFGKLLFGFIVVY